MAGTPDPIVARRLAEIAHAGQQYAPRMPYSFHLESVVGVLTRFGITKPVMICAGWTHDAIEDTTVSYSDVENELGKDVAELVFAVSSELGRNRKERNEKTYPKIRANPSALILKLADRIANVEFGLANGGKTEMYEREYPDFRKALYQKLDGEEGLILERMWGHLDRLIGDSK